MNKTIDIQRVSKSYDGTPVLEDVSFSVAGGQVCGLIGYNGAGKTTLLRIIAGVCRPDRGGVFMDSASVWDNASAKGRLFMLCDEMYYPPRATLADMRDFHAGYCHAWSDAVFSKLCRAFQLDPAREILGFSRGMHRQAGMALAFSAMPEFLLLDEIFDGLDLAMRNIMRDLLKDYIRATGAAVVVASHNLRELEEGIDQIVLLRNSRIGYVGDVAEIQDACGSLEQYFLSDSPALASDFHGVFSKTDRRDGTEQT